MGVVLSLVARLDKLRAAVEFLFRPMAVDTCIRFGYNLTHFGYLVVGASHLARMAGNRRGYGVVLLARPPVFPNHGLKDGVNESVNRLRQGGITQAPRCRVETDCWLLYFTAADRSALLSGAIECVSAPAPSSSDITFTKW